MTITPCSPDFESRLADYIQVGLANERALHGAEEGFYTPSPGQIWSHVDHRVARETARLVVEFLARHQDDQL